MKYLLILLSLLTSACTGPFGIVVGGERVHEIYNQRVRAAALSDNYGAPMDSYSPREKVALQTELDRKRRY